MLSNECAEDTTSMLQPTSSCRNTFTSWSASRLDIPLAEALKAIKLSVARRRREHPFWSPRYYDFNVFTEKKRIEKLRYIHRNPVARGLVSHPEDWPWSSFLHYATGIEGIVEIESHWTASRRNRATQTTRVTPILNPEKHSLE